MKTDNQRCVYCLGDGGKITIDHVIPSAWFPATTPQNVERWKVPCCIECNNRYSRIEKNILERLGLCLDPSDPRAHGIPQKALRALKPLHGKSSKDCLARAKKRKTIAERMYDSPDRTQKGILPHFGPPHGISPENPAVVFIHGSDLIEIGKKLIRGLIYVRTNQYVGPEYNLEAHIITEEGSIQLREIYARFCRYFDLGPGVEGSFEFTEKPPAGLFFFRFWGKLELHGSVIHRDDAKGTSRSQ